MGCYFSRTPSFVDKQKVDTLYFTFFFKDLVFFFFSNLTKEEMKAYQEQKIWLCGITMHSS